MTLAHTWPSTCAPSPGQCHSKIVQGLYNYQLKVMNLNLEPPHHKISKVLPCKFLSNQSSLLVPYTQAHTQLIDRLSNNNLKPTDQSSNIREKWSTIRITDRIRLLSICQVTNQSINLWSPCWSNSLSRYGVESRQRSSTTCICYTRYLVVPQ